jgi:hypothetical protein
MMYRSERRRGGAVLRLAAAWEGVDDEHASAALDLTGNANGDWVENRYDSE